VIYFVTVQFATAYKILSKSHYISLKYGDTMAFKFAIIRHFEFSKFEICRIRSWILSYVVSSYNKSLW